LKVLVFGAGGQVGQALRMTSPFPDAAFVDRSGADLREPEALRRAIDAASPALVINAAAVTAVDRAEADPATAFAVNEEAPAAMAIACAARGARLIQLSTDYVFDGSLRRPYRPDDAARPLNVYGASKLAGEQRLRETPGLKYLILRTAWVYSHLGKNFFNTMLDLGQLHGQVRVVADQVGSPTSVWTLAEAIWRAARLPDCGGTAHFTDSAAVSRIEFARAIFSAAAAVGLPCGDVTVEAISSTQFAQQHPGCARRPGYSVLDSADFRRRIGFGSCDWLVALRAAVGRLAGVAHA
jgi:dTDP-4-dehydrorhamnose reductase